MPDEAQWVTLFNPSLQATHRVPDHPQVVRDFQDRGWETEADTAERVAVEAEELKGKALEDALRQAGLPTSGTADEKRARLAEHEAKSAITTTEEEGSE